MRILITGSRRWTDRYRIETALRSATAGRNSHEVTVVHGECPYGGADIIAAAIADRIGYVVEPHPASWKVHGKAAGPIRNQEMVDLGADVCLAFPHADSRGTWDCVKRADAAGIPVIVDSGAGPYVYTKHESRPTQ